MKFLTLQNIKAHSRIDYDCEDSLLELYGEAAEDTLLNHIGMTYEQVIAKYTTVPMPLVQAALMLVDVSYQHRNPVSSQNMSVVPYTFDILVKPYVIL